MSHAARGGPATSPGKAHPARSARAPGVPCLGPARTAEPGAGRCRGVGAGNNGEPVLGRPGGPVPAAGASPARSSELSPGPQVRPPPVGGGGGSAGTRPGGGDPDPGDPRSRTAVWPAPGKSVETDHPVTGQRRLEGSIIYYVVLTSPVWDFTSVARFPPICCSRPSFWRKPRLLQPKTVTPALLN